MFYLSVQTIVLSILTQDCFGGEIKHKLRCALQFSPVSVAAFSD